MKKYILTLLTSVSFLAANAQAQSWLLYGNLSLSTTNTGLASTTWSFSPGIGYQINDNWTVGINLAWSQTPTNRDTANNLVILNQYWGGPFVRYSHNISSMFYCYTQLDLNYMGQYRTPGDHPADEKASGFGATITPAIGVRVGKGYALNFAVGGLGYTSVTTEVGSIKTNNFNLSFGQTLMVGLSKNFGGNMHGHTEPGAELRKMDSDDDK